MAYLLIGESEEVLTEFIKCYSKCGQLIELDEAGTRYDGSEVAIPSGLFYKVPGYSEAKIIALLRELKAHSKRDVLEIKAIIFLYPIYGTRWNVIASMVSLLENMFGDRIEIERRVICLVGADESTDENIEERTLQMSPLSRTIIALNSEQGFNKLKKSLEVHKSLMPVQSTISAMISQFNAKEGRFADETKENKAPETRSIPFSQIISFNFVHQEMQSLPGILNIVPGLLIPYVLRLCTSPSYLDTMEKPALIDLPTSMKACKLRVKNLTLKEESAMIGGTPGRFKARIEGDRLIMVSEIYYRAAQFGNYWVAYRGTCEVTNQ